MTKLEKLEHEISSLGPAELAAFRKWFREYDAEQWNRELERDAASGKLDELAEKAISDHRAGRIKEI